jgi:hypothetical protein
MQSNSNGPNKPALYKALGVLFFGLAIFFAIPSLYEIQQATQAADWIPRSARIINAEVAQYGGGRAHDIPRHTIDIQGTFSDSNQIFKVERIAFAQFNDLSQIRAVVAQYPPGSELIVYVAPDNPARVVLQKDVDISPMALMICLGGVCALLGAVAYLKGKKLGEYHQGQE